MQRIFNMLVLVGLIIASVVILLYRWISPDLGGALVGVFSVSLLLYVIYSLRQDQKQLQKLVTASERFVPHEFLAVLEKESIADLELGDQVEKEMSIVFVDIRDFTTLSEGMRPDENFKFLNSYLSQIGPLVSAHHGFIDKYLGDGIMALFSTCADDAVDGCIAMLNKLSEYNLRTANGRL